METGRSFNPTAENILEHLTSQSDINDELGLIGLQFDELDVGIGSSLVNNALRDIEVQSHHGYLIVGIRHADGSTVPTLLRTRGLRRAIS